MRWCQRVAQLWRIDLGVNIRAGAHYTQYQVYDYDGDGSAELVTKTADGTIGTLLFGTGLGHGDAQHTSDLDPSRPGMETFSAHEEMKKSGNRGATMRDARTGEILWDLPSDRDTRLHCTKGSSSGSRRGRCTAQ